MAKMSYEQFANIQASRTNSRPSQQSSFSNGPSYFNLTEDGETAVVRFDIADINDVAVYSRHSIVLNDKRREVECLRGYGEPADACPLCRAGEKRGFRIYLPLISYTTAPDGTITAQPCIWSQPARFRETLLTYYVDYGDLRNVIFKVTRHGARGDTSTTYSLTIPNPSIYRVENYPADFSAFETFDLHRSMLLSKTAEELEYFLTHKSFPDTQSQQSSPQSAASVQRSAPRSVVTPTPHSEASQTSRDRRANLDTLSSNATPIRTAYTPKEESETAETPSAGPRRYTY